jgi:peptidoglycan/LPS O-acetylase OafA/YrhL
VLDDAAGSAGVTPRRLAGLDGIRGLAALYVVMNHIFERAFPGYPVDRAPFWAGWFIYGRFAVVVFIVLSGFSLALAPARRGWRLGGASRFAYRRARRWANRERPSRRQPRRAGASASENPDRTMNTTTANRP